MRIHHLALSVASVLTTLFLLSAEARLGPAAAQEMCSSETVDAAERQEKPVDMVICLDTSGSMTALIDSARGRIWDIVTELSKATPTPRLRVGLLTYGTPDTSTAEKGWVVRQIDLTDDLDAFYAKMMALTTSGGDEFVGWVLSDAVHTMSWSDKSDALKLIFVAGNESADQGSDQRNFRYVAEAARAADIIVNPVYAGQRDQGVTEMWDQVATHGGGDYAAIDMKAGTIQIATPQDAILNALNGELNATYIPYGALGAAGLANQLAQDANAGKMGVQSCSSRVAAKGCGLYSNASWDLVDATTQAEFDLTALKTHELPEHMRDMTPDARRNYVEGVRAVRKAIHDKIQTVTAERKVWLQTETRKRGGGESLDNAILASLRRQAGAKGFTFKTATVTAAPVVEPQMTVPETAPVKSLSGRALIQLAALESSRPVVAYRVGAYESKQEPFAALLAARIKEPVRFAVGEHEFKAMRPAREKLVEVLEQFVSAMQEIEVIPPAIAQQGPTGQPKPSVTYRLGGLTFGTLQDVEFAYEQVTAAAMKFDTANPLAVDNPAPTQGRTRLAGYDKPSEQQLLDRITHYNDKIKVLSHAAAQAFSDRGC
jgi:hypothetical protein